MYAALIAAAVVLLPVLAFALLRLISPRPTNLGITEGSLAPCPRTPNCVSTQATDPSQQISPFPFQGTRAESIARVKSVLASLPRMSIVQETDDYLHVEATTRLFRFIDDVEFHFDDTIRQIHFRSASRIGHSDLGVNRARMEQIRGAYAAQ